MPRVTAPSRHRRAVVCSVGSTDPIAASGLAADLRVYDLLAVQPVFVVTAVTAQNSLRVRAVEPLAPRIIVAQLQCIWEQVRPDAICIGLIPHARGLRAVRVFLGSLGRKKPPIVLDPVLQASSGKKLAHAGAQSELRKLLPLVSVVTPNVDEARRLSGLPIATLQQAKSAAAQLSRHGCDVLLTGGHLAGAQSIDVFAHRAAVRTFSQMRVAADMRGKGGLLAAALTAQLAKGEDLLPAIEEARRFVLSALRSAQRLGNGKRQLSLSPRAGDDERKRSRERIS